MNRFIPWPGRICTDRYKYQPTPRLSSRPESSLLALFNQTRQHAVDSHPARIAYLRRVRCFETTEQLLQLLRVLDIDVARIPERLCRLLPTWFITCESTACQSRRSDSSKLASCNSNSNENLVARISCCCCCVVVARTRMMKPGTRDLRARTTKPTLHPHSIPLSPLDFAPLTRPRTAPLTRLLRSTRAALNACTPLFYRSESQSAAT